MQANISMPEEKNSIKSRIIDKINEMQGAVKLNGNVVTNYLESIEILDSPQLQVGKHRFFKLVYKGE